MTDAHVYPPFDIPNLKYLDTASVHEFVVKLNFISGGKSVATGFFINIPESPCEVILTAGHNLYNPKTKSFTTDVKVLFPHPSSPEGYAMPIPPEHIKVSAEYLKDTELKEADYGVILIPYTKKMPRRGFGFKMTHAFTELRGEVKVSTYRGGTTAGRPVMSSGPVLVNQSTENQLVYDAETEPGNSGSPVWFAHGKESTVFTVVAVHNNGPKDGTKGSRGSRISPKLLRDVFTWANLDTAKRIKAHQTQSTVRSSSQGMDLPKEGLFMVFGGKDFAQVQRVSGTTFNVFPAQVTPGGNIRHALALGTEWVRFDTENQKAVLVNSPTEQSLITIKELNNKQKNPGVVTIALADDSRLRMESKFKPIDLLEARLPGLSMVAGKSVPFSQFMLESDPSVPYKPFTQLIATAVQDDSDPHDLRNMLCPDCRSKLEGLGASSNKSA